jgi:hypothetical protein
LRRRASTSPWAQRVAGPAKRVAHHLPLREGGAHQRGAKCLNNNYTEALGFFYKGDLGKEQGGVLVPPLTTADTRPLPVTFLASNAAVGKLMTCNI